MKKIIVFSFVFFCLLAIGCVKQKNCDCGLKGKFVYYENQEEIIYCGHERKVNAAFFSTDQPEFPYYIVNSVPAKFKLKDTLNVIVCLEQEKRDICMTYGIGSVYKLKCIKKED